MWHKLGWEERWSAATETDFNLVECFDPASNQCRLSSHCRLKGVLGQAMQAYPAVLDGVTLADLVVPTSPQRVALQATVAAPRAGSARRKAALVSGLPDALGFE